jgi:two-component system chemotaxis sensor kinase CheA
VIENLGKLSDAIDQLAIQIVLAEPDDLVALGSVLNQIEDIEKMGLGGDLKSLGILIGAIKKIVEKIILNEINEPQKGVNLTGKGIKIIQIRISNSNKLQSLPEEEIFWKEMKSLIGIDQSDLLTDALENTNIFQENTSLKGSADLTQDIGLLKDFIIEALEHLESIELNIINLEQSPEDKECVNAIFRPFHTIKGVSGFLNLQQIHKFSHAVESLLDHARNDKLRINQKVIDFILEAVDLLKNMIIDLKIQIDTGQPGQSNVDLEPYLDKIAILEKGEASDQKLEEGEDGSIDEFELKKLPLGKILSSKGIVSEKEISEALREQREEKPDFKLGEILVMENKAKPKEVVEALREQKQILSQLTETTLKVDSKKLDNLVDMVGELVIAQSLVQQNSVFASIKDQKLIRDFSQLKRITNDLQRISLSLRMVPIRQTFQKMTRLVRDLAKKSEKLVELVMSGEETEIDRNMVESLYDPLVHMIRNAVDHGIEPPLRRREMGKAEMGKVFLRAYQKGGNIVIELEDDGQGLNREKILKKAKERGLLPEEVQLTDYQIDNLIFEPGFSTADKITDVSGRGVGMDVVRRAIEKLRGKVEIFTIQGKGCRFIIRVPLTLAIMDGIIVRIGEEQYIIPALFIKETLRPLPEDIITVQQRGNLVKVRDNLLPLIRLHHLLGVIPQKKEPWEALVVVVENEGNQRCLMVDDLIGKQEVVIKNLGEKLKEVKGVAGATIMGDGHVGLILDIHGIFEIYEKA